MTDSNTADQARPLSRLGELMRDLRAAAAKGDPAVCHEPMSGTTRQIDGLMSLARFSDLSFVIDEPVSFGGNGAAPNPAEVMMGGVGASIEVTLRCWADMLGIPVDGVSVELSGALDSRGFFDIDPDVRAGFPEIRVNIRVKSKAPQADLDRLLAIVNRSCPVLETVRNPVNMPVSLTRVD